MCSSIHFDIWKINTTGDLLAPAAASQLVHSLVTSQLDSFNGLLLGVAGYKIKRLQRIHNIAATIVVCTPHGHDNDEVFQ